MENSILKDAICEIARMKEAQSSIATISERTYLISDGDYTEIDPNDFSLPDRLEFTSLDGLVQTLKSELKEITAKTHTTETLYVNVETPKKVAVYTGLDEYNRRAEVYRASCPREGWQMAEKWLNHESVMIALQSQFQPNEGTAYLLDFLSRITDESSVSSEDNGVTQNMQVKKGVALVTKEQIKPVIPLRPYRTFMEVEQPESLFLVRVREGCEVGLFEADGGMWQFEARKRIRNYLKTELAELVEAGKVVVAM